MNFLDRTIGWFSPGAGLRRARARAAFDLARTYEGAKTGRRTSSWIAPNSSANAELYGALERLRARSRDLVRNNPHARRAIAALVANAIGTGIEVGVPARPGKVWKAWSAECDFFGELGFGGIQALTARAVFESGEGLIVRAKAAGASRSEVPLRLKVLEADYIDATRHGPQPNGNFAVTGIELDRQGRKVAYWLYPQHPGDSAIFNPRLNSVRVPAEDVIHVFEKERPGQLRGVPRLSSTILKLRDLDEYQDALLVKKKIEACFAAFVTSDEDSRTVGTTVSTEETTDGTAGRRLESLSPGVIEYLKPGEDVSFSQPSTAAGESEYTHDQLLAIAMGAGLTYEQLTGDLSNANFSSMRAGRQEFKALIEQFRWLTFIPMVCERVWGWFEESAYFAGKIQTTGYEHIWTPPRWEYVDPMKDVQADKEELAGCLSSLSAKLRERGEDPEAVFAEIAQERKRLADLGIAVDYSVKDAGTTDVGAPTDGAGGDGKADPPPPNDRGRLALVPRNIPEAPPRAGLRTFGDTEMAEAANRDVGDLPLQTRFAPIATVDREARTADLVWTRAGAQVKRYDWRLDRYYMEELSLEPAAVRMGRLQSGSAPFLRDHGYFEGINAQIGVVASAAIGNGEGTANVRFSKRDEVTPIFNDVADGILRNVSVGYVVHRYEMLPPQDGSDVWTYRATDWEPMEISLVAIPADPGAGVRDARPDEKTPCFRCEFITPAAAAGSSSINRNEETTMTDKVTPTVPAAEPNAGNEAALAQAREEAAKAERARVTAIQERAKKAGVDEAFVAPFIDEARSVDEFCRALVDKLAEKPQPADQINGRRLDVVQDERSNLRMLVSAAIVHRMDPKAELPNGAGEYRYMSLSRLAEEILGREGVAVRGLSRLAIAERALHSTSDFPNILADAFNKRLRNAYIENQPSYTVWTRRAPNAPDFKAINVTQLSSAPDLQKVLEGGEFKQGSMSDGKETYQVLTYGRIVGISRQALINDDMSAFDRLPRLLGNAARRLENRTVYGVLTANAAMADGGALFNVTAVTTAGGHANYATGTGSVLGTGSLKTGRAAMRVQKGLNSEELNIAPRYAIVPAALEQDIYQLTSANYTPTKPSDVNEFRMGGRTALEPVVEAYLDGSSTTAWYLAADSAQIDTVEYCYLDGSEGLYLETQIGFDVDGMKVKARLDFAAAAIDFRGLYSGKGA